MTTRQLRLLRAASASSVATLLAAVSHTLAGGPAPHPLLVLALSALLIPVAAVLIGTRPARTRTALTVAVSQAIFHVVFQALGAPTDDGAVAVGAHVHHLPVLGPLSPAALPDAAMLTGHAVAAALTVVLFWHGENMISAIACWVHAVLRRAAVALPADHERPAALDLDLHPLVDAVVATAVSRRGPPAFA